MQKITGFTITKLTLAGFKCFEDTTVFDFGDMTFITASNGQGKSSIADAIAFAFVGVPFFGDKGLDRLQNRNTLEMTVSVDFVDDTGAVHSLTRTRKRDATTISYDGGVVRQSDLNEAFGGKDVFLSILNPLYFINVLGDNGKGLLEKLLPAVKHEDVMAALSAHSQEVLAGQSLLSPETFIKNRRSELKELNETLISYRGQKELLDHQREERAAKLDELQKSIDGISDEMKHLIMIRDENRDPEADKLSLEELRSQRAQLLAGAADNSTEKAVQELMREIKAVEKSIAKQAAKQYVSPFTEQLAQADADLKGLYAEHGRLDAALKNAVPGYKCPVCAAAVTEENAPAVQADLRQRLSALVHDGKVAKIHLAAIKSQDRTAQDVFDQEKATSLETANEKLAELNQRLEEMNVARELEMEDYGKRLSDLEVQISEQENRVANGNWSQEQTLRFGELDEQRKGYQAQMEALSGVEDYDYTKLISDTEDEIIRLKNLINEAIQYMTRRIELMLGGLKMSSTEIVLTEIIKSTGEVKDCFRFSYEGRDYKCLSLSEKVRAGLDVATLIQRLSGRNYPIFVDNGESICTFGKVQLTGQVILARVANKQPLQVVCRNREQPRMAA